MHQVNIHQAKTQLSQLIAEVLQGEEVIIAKRNKPLVRLSLLGQATAATRRIGGAKHLVTSIAKDFDEPMEDFKDYL